jgi:predicted GIY-YIG superfamily endonuclease
VSEQFFVYLLELRGGALYAGHTRDIAQRLRRHAQGSGSRLTRLLTSPRGRI